VERTVSDHGRVEIVVNNAGLMLLGPLPDTLSKEWDRIVALIVQGVL
jgi:NADP-dependent 3-hydroxy acid dehydrogenase YdfG